MDSSMIRKDITSIKEISNIVLPKINCIQAKLKKLKQRIGRSPAHLEENTNRVTELIDEIRICCIENHVVFLESRRTDKATQTNLTLQKKVIPAQPSPGANYPKSCVELRYQITLMRLFLYELTMYKPKLRAQIEELAQNYERISAGKIFNIESTPSASSIKTKSSERNRNLLKKTFKTKSVNIRMADQEEISNTPKIIYKKAKSF